MGDKVVFSWNGPKQDNTDLYIQQIGAGAPRRLTTDPNGDHHPAWSPDGRAIAFLRSGLAGGRNEVRVSAVPGRRRTQTRQISRRACRSAGSSRFAWCPDSTCVLVTDSTGPGKSDALFAVSLDGGEKRQVTYPDGLVADVDPAMSPDGRSLIFRRHSAPFSGAFYRLALDGRAMPRGEPVRLTASLSFGRSTWTRDSHDSCSRLAAPCGVSMRREAARRASALRRSGRAKPGDRSKP